MGLSEWTNEAGARAVAAGFPDFPCTPVKVRPCVDPDDSLKLDMIQVRGELLACVLLLLRPTEVQRSMFTEQLIQASLDRAQENSVDSPGSA